jgi:hypothetical protein
MVYLICMLGDVVCCVREVWDVLWVARVVVVFDRRRDFERVERAVTCFGGLRHLCKHSKQFLVLHIHLRRSRSQVVGEIDCFQ